MSTDNYTDLKANIASWIMRSDLTSVIPDFITLCEQRIYRGCDPIGNLPAMEGLRVRAMETALDETIASGVIAVPTGYLELKHAYINSTPTKPLERKSPEWIYENYPTRSAQDKPATIAREGDNFIFGSYPDSTYNVKGIYYKELDPLSDSNLTNWFTDNAYGLLLFGSLVEAADYVNDTEKMMKYEKRFRDIYSSIQSDDNKENFSGSTLRATCG